MERLLAPNRAPGGLDVDPSTGGLSAIPWSRVRCGDSRACGWRGSGYGGTCGHTVKNGK